MAFDQQTVGFRDGTTGVNGPGMDAPVPSPGDVVIAVDQAVLDRVWRRRRRSLQWGGPLLALAILAAFLTALPRQYTATASVAVQQGSANTLGGALETITKGKSTGKASYDGVINSRRFAIIGLKAGSLDKLYRFNDEDDAVEFMQDAVMLVDRYDGLLYVQVTLSGPPRIGRKERVTQVRNAARKVADAYVAALKDYIAFTNTDHDVSLLREGEQLVAKSQNDYEAAVQALSDFVKKDRPAAVAGDALGMVSALGAGGSAPTGLSDLQALYESRAQLEIQLRAAEEERKGTSALARRVTADGGDALPGEDPLLADARRQVRMAEQYLQTLRITLAETNPEVVAAHQRLNLARKRLNTEQAAILKDVTSASVDLAGMRERYRTVQEQIRRSENDFKSSRNLATELEVLRNDVLLKLEVLKAAETNFAILKVQSVATDSSLDVIDAARVPEKGKPGGAVLVVSSIVLAALILMVWLAIEYWREKRRAARTPFASAAPYLPMAPPAPPLPSPAQERAES